ncbi:MAG: STAS domain-containing protein [Planctomycetes bacterium]|nr:STAS domain-containing protein [Planctomycetota bacterium]
MPDLEVRSVPLRDARGVVALEVRGAVTSQSAKALRGAIARRVGAADACVLISLREVPYVNSSGVGFLIDLATEMDRRGGAVVLVEVSAKVKLVLEHLGVAAYFRFEPAMEAALAFGREISRRCRAMPRIVDLRGKGEYPLGDRPVRIGADPGSTIVVSHPQAEPCHAEVYVSDGRCFVRDLGTRAGTYVGERRIQTEALRPGDVVRVGDARLMFAEGSGPQ